MNGSANDEKSKRWLIWWEMADGQILCVKDRSRSMLLSRSDVEGWAKAQVQAYPNKYARFLRCCPDASK